MNCDDFLPALEAGGPFRRRLARRHARRCPRCAAAAAGLAAVKARWADPPALSSADRAVWERVAASETGSEIPAVGRRVMFPARRRFPVALAAGLAAAACVAVVVFVIVRHKAVDIAKHPGLVPPTQPVTPAIVSSPVRVEVVDAAGELGRLSAAVDELDARMRDLDRRAQRAEARRQVASALDQFGRW